jgi:hypothetical protein
MKESLIEKIVKWHVRRKFNRAVKKANSMHARTGYKFMMLFKFNVRHFSIFKAIGVFLYTNVVCLFPGIRKITSKK